ncbi:CHAT domain-containing protein [Lactarius hengduanensis]|nr:CHAT domain-containing protein [Lactarius hengduanensis]
MGPELSIADTDDLIASLQNSISLFPRLHSEHATSVYRLAKTRYLRYGLSRQKEDLDKSILHFTEAILLPPVSQAGPLFHVAWTLFDLAAVLLYRVKDFDQTEDVESHVMAMLIQALGAQVKLGSGDWSRNIWEMAVLCRELLTSNISTDLPVEDAAFTYFVAAFLTEAMRGRSIQLLNEVIECLRDAVKICPPGSHLVFFALASALCTRFVASRLNDDYEEAAAILENILDHNQPVECPDSIRHLASTYVTMIAFARSIIFKNPEHIEVAISRLRAELSSSSIPEEHRFYVAQNLSMLVKNRFINYSIAESHEESDSYLSQVVDLSLSREYVELDDVLETYSTAALQQKIRHLKELISNTALGTEHHKRLLWRLANWYRAKFSRTNDISDIEESVKYSRLRLDSTHLNDPWRVNPLGSLSEILLLAFEHTNKTDYLDESIIVDYDILKLNSARNMHFHTIRGLVSSLLTRSRLLGRSEDFHEAVRLMSLAVDDQYTQGPDRFRLSCNWALLARSTRHPSVLTAYKSSISLIQRSFSFAPTVSIQHARLVEMGEHCQTMPFDYASYQIDLEDSPLAKRFAEINQELEAMTVSVTPSGRPQMEDGIAQGGDWTDPFGRLLVKQRKLLDERDELVSQIQGQPGLEGFLKAPPFTTLRPAASRGPVILINHCEWRSDILIVFHNSLPCAIPTANDFYVRANTPRDELVEVRKHGLDSLEYQDALCTKGLYELVGAPVIERLRVLCAYRSNLESGGAQLRDTPDRYFSDLYIPSYTPSLSALIESRNSSPQKLDKLSLLLVAQPDDSLPGVDGEAEIIRKLEAPVTVTGLVSSEATPASVVEGLRGSRLAHFACHGVLETGKPFEASFKLHGDSRLTLLDIVRSRQPNAEFAFLSCCHAAEITDESIADEGLHLTAAMQYCGFRSVIGTMWEMADTDGRDLARSFYKSLFSSERPGVPYYERTAEALRDATQMLRKKRGITLERWVNFAHYGA